MQRLKPFANHYKSSLALLLMMNGFFGAMVGILTATWQMPVETAQVLLRLVFYPQGSLPYMYYAGTFSIVNYIGCLFLAITNSEMVSSILICAVVGCVLQQTLAMTIFLILRNAYLATLATLVLVAIHFMGAGIAYPIFLTGTEHTYGRIGLFLIIYAALFFAFSKWRTGFLLSGLALGIHPGWGLWLNACLLVVMAIEYRRVKEIAKIKYALSFFCGIGISILAYVWQKTHFPMDVVIPPENSTQAKEIFLNYIKYWDYHRQKFDNPRVLFNGFSLAGLSFYFSYLFMRKRNGNITLGERVFFWFVMVSTLVSSLLVFIPSWFNPVYFPVVFIELMTGRFINVSIFLCTPLLMATGLLWLSEWRLASSKIKFPTLFLAQIIVIAFAVIGATYGYTLASMLSGLMFVLIGIAACVACSRYLTTPRNYLLEKLGDYPWIKPEPANAYLAVICMVLLVLAPIYTINYFPETKPQFDTISIPHIENLILTPDDLVQFKTRAGTLTAKLDAYVMEGQAAMMQLERTSKDIFGISLLKQPLANWELHRGGFMLADFKALWEARNCTDWESLSKKYGFGLILTPSTMHLQLPRVDNDPRWNKYYPVCGR